MEWVETTAKTVEEAKDSALDRLGVHEDDAEFDVVSEAKTGLFGRVKEEARVRARVRPTTPRNKDDRRRRGRGKGNGGNGGNGKGRGKGGGQQGQGRSRDTGGRGKSDGNQESGSGSGDRNRNNRGQGDAGGQGGQRQGNKSRNKGGNDNRGNENRASKPTTAKKEDTVTDEPTMPLSEQATLAEDFVKGLAECFGSEVTFERTDVDPDIHVLVKGDNLGRMIGRRGNTAMAIDELVRTVLQRQAGSSRDGRIRLDVGGVRARRAEALAGFCLSVAAEVREDGVARSLEPMGGADRKVVHDTLSEEDGVSTISEGEDPNRRVVIVPAGDAD